MSNEVHDTIPRVSISLRIPHAETHQVFAGKRSDCYEDVPKARVKLDLNWAEDVAPRLEGVRPHHDSDIDIDLDSIPRIRIDISSHLVDRSVCFQGAEVNDIHMTYQ